MFILSGLFISWVRGSWQLQIFTIAYEVHEAFTMPFYYYLFINLYRETEERRTLIWLLVSATVFKGLDGIAIYLWSHDEAKSWGVLQMWRDGFLLAFGIVSGLHLLLYKGKYYARLRTFMLWGFPIIAFALILSYRRTFIVAMLTSVIVMFVSVGKGRRKKHALYFFIMLLSLCIAILATDPIAMIGRLSGIIQPKQEGSAYIRLMELPNILQNIYHNPIFGTPIGVGWHQYYRMPTSAIFTLFGTHNTYLYWPLRAGILGSIGFVLLVSRMVKCASLCYRLSRTEEDFFISQLMLHMLVIYLFACFFGMMYGDAVTVLMGMLLAIYQLEMEHLTSLRSLKHVRFFASLRTRSVVLKPSSM
jgi:O-antigen ligase